jgi:hypothetical protein
MSFYRKDWDTELITDARPVELKAVLCQINPLNREERNEVVELAHTWHQGRVKTKRPIRSRVWFEGIDSAVERRVKGCKECQANSDKPAYEPLKPS